MASVITIGLIIWLGYAYWPLINAILCAAMTPYVVLGLTVWSARAHRAVKARVALLEAQADRHGS